MRYSKTKTIVYSGLLTAAITLATAYLKYPVATGYIHLGDGIIFLAAILLGPVSALAAGIGSALADVLLGYGIYAPATFFIKALMALIVAFLIKKDAKHKIRNIVVFIFAELIMIVGYFGYDVVIYSLPSAIINIGPNVIQAIFGVIIGVIFLPISKKIRL